MTVKELREEAKSLGLVGYSKLNKADLEQLISVTKSEVIEMTKEEFETSVTANTENTKVLCYDNEDDWHELRAKRIGGSDIGAIIGVNPYKSIVDVYVDKTEGSNFKGNELTHWGHMLEGTILKEFSNKHKELIVYEVPYSVVNDFLIANLDGALKDKETGDYGVLEIKTTSLWNKKDWEDDVIPQYYYAQVQHYLMLTGYKFAYIAVLIGGQQYKEFKIERSEEDINLIRNKATEFYQENLLKKIPPMPDGSDAYMQHLKKKAMEIENNKIIELVGFEEKVEMLKNVTREKKELEKTENLLKEEIMLEMIREKTLKAVVGKSKFNILSKKSLDKKKLGKEKPQLLKEYEEYIEKFEEQTKDYLKESKYIMPYLEK
ncbi:lambda-exonuclease family protein [Fusobacterium nucleatum]|uniref:lambda-exonuclease family protein n=1 Tax=Fusobacterium nucleatum TaxID=851 RepID=UPI0030CC6829